LEDRFNWEIITLVSRHCSDCYGYDYGANEKFCSRCGKKTKVSSTEEVSKSEFKHAVLDSLRGLDLRLISQGFYDKLTKKRFVK